MLYTYFWNRVKTFQCSRRQTLENLHIWDAVINVSGQHFTFACWGSEKQESATGDPHQRSRQMHLPACQISCRQIGRKLKTPGQIQIWSLLWECKEVWKALTETFMPGINTPWELQCFSLWFCHPFSRNISSNMKEWDHLVKTVLSLCHFSQEAAMSTSVHHSSIAALLNTSSSRLTS